MDVLKNSKALKHEEQMEYLQKYQENKSQHIRDILINANLKLVKMRVSKFVKKSNFKYGKNADDLFQEGCIGLMKGIEHFNPNLNVKLSTYAVYWIDSYIIRYIAKHSSRFVRINTSDYNNVILQNLNNPNSIEKLINSSSNERKEKIEYTLSVISNNNRNLDINKLSSHNDQEELTIKNDIMEKLNGIIERCNFSIREKYILENRIINDICTLDNIGVEFGITRERVRQIEENILSKLKSKVGHIIERD